MRIQAKLHCQNMQKNTTLQENDLKIPAKFGTRIEMSGGQAVQADWAQNDSTATNYVKNRPGGYYGDSVTVDEEIYSGEIERTQSEMEVDWLLVAGQTYKVTIGEVTKTYTAFSDTYSGFIGVTIGDGTITDAAESGEVFALFTTEIDAGKVALLACLEEDVGKVLRITQSGTVREVHKIPAELLDLGSVVKSLMQMSANIKELGDQHASDMSSINKTLTEGPITFERGSDTLALGKDDFNNGLILRWDNVNGGYTMLSQSGLVAKYSDVEFFMTVFNVSLIEKTHDSGIHFKLEKSDINGGTRFILDNVAGDKTTFYASGKIINSNKLLQLSANDTITEDNATTLRGVKTPEQEYDAANKKYVDEHMTLSTNDYELVFEETIAEDAALYMRDTDKDGNPFSLTDVMVIIFTEPFAESSNSAGRALGFLPTTRWGYDTLGSLRNSIKSGGSDVGRYEVLYAKVINNYQIVDKYYESQNTTNVFGTMEQSTRAGASGIMFHTDANKLMEISSPKGNITCVKIVGYTNPLVSAGTIVALYKKKGT